MTVRGFAYRCPWTRPLLALLLAALCLSPSLLAQTTGAVSGTVSDQSGGVLPGVEITLRNVNTGQQRSTISDDEGRFSIQAVALGEYELTAELSGFQKAVQQGVRVNLNATAVVNFSMSVGEMTEEVIVRGQAVKVNTSTATITNLVEESQIQDLPLNGRSFGDLVTLEAGVTSFKNTLSSAGTGTDFGGTGVRLVINGLRPELSNILVDGIDAVDAYGNAPGSAAGVLLGVDTLQQFEVLASNYSAEFGRSAGGTINTATKSGTNDIHGSAFWFHRNDNLDARNFFDTDPSNPGDRGGQPEFKRNQFGVTIGGPIQEDSTFFFVSYEGLRDRLGVTRRPRTITQAARDGQTLPAGVEVSPNSALFFQLFPLPNGRVFGDGSAEFIFSQNVPTDEDFFLVKVDHNFENNSSFFVRYSIDDAESLSASGGLPPNRLGRESRQQLFAASYTAVLSPALLNTARFGWNRSTQIVPELPISIAPELSFFQDNTGVGCINVIGLVIAGCQGSIGSTVPDQFQFNEDLIYSTGSHNLKFGAVFKRFHYNDDRTFQPGGQWAFEGLDNFLVGNPVSVVIDDPETDYFTDQRFSVFGWYIQDDWKVSPRLTLNLGVRHEIMTTPSVASGADVINYRGSLESGFEPVVGKKPIQNPGKKNFAPRLGFAWDPTGSGKTSIRGGFGLFFQQLNEANLNFVFRLSQNVGRTQTTLVGGPGADARYPFFAPAEPFTPNIVFPLQYNAQMPYTVQWNLSLQRELAPGWVAQAAYLANRGVHLARPTELNFRRRCPNNPFCPPDAPAGFFPGGPPLREITLGFPSLNAFNLRDFGGNSSYHGLALGLRKRFDKGYQFQLTYTWSKTIDDTPPILRDFENAPPILFDYQNPHLDKSLSGFHVGRKFSANFTWELPVGDNAFWLAKGWQVNGILTLADGNPFTIINLFDRARTAAIGPFRHDRPNLVPGANNNPITGNPANWFDATNFELQTPGFLGDVGRNTADGPGLANFDLSFFKTTALSEEVDFQFRFEIFNLFNRANFGTPQGGARAAFAPAFTLTGFDAILNPAAGRLTNTVTTSRQIQFAIKFLF